MRRPHPGLLLAFALATLVAGPARATAPDSAFTAALDAARAAAYEQRWAIAEARSRDALIQAPVLAPDGTRLDEAIDTFVRARRASGADSLAAFAAVDTFALRVYESGRFRVARRMLERSLTWRSGALDTLDFVGARCAHLLGNIVFDLGEYEYARDLYLRGKAVYERLQGPRGRHVSMMRYNLSNCAYLLGDAGEARRLLLEVLDDSYARQDSSSVGDAYLNLGAVLGALRDPLGSRRALEQCIEVRRAIGRSGAWIGEPFLNLAGTYLATGDAARALALLDSSAAHLEGAIREDHPDWATMADTRSDVLRALGRHDEAQAEAERCLALREKIFGAEHPDVADAHAGLAEVFRARARWAEALRESERAAAIDEKLLPAEHPRRADDRLQLARAWFGLGDSARALALGMEAEEGFRAHLQLTAAGMVEAEALRQDDERRAARDLALEVLSGRPDPAEAARVLESVVRSRAGVLDLQMLRLHALGEGPEVAALRAAYERACTRVANLVVRGPGAGSAEEHRAKLDTAYAERRHAELALAARSRAYRQDRHARAASLADMRAQLPAGAALVSFVRHEDSSRWPGAPGARYSAFVARAGGDVQFRPLGEAARIESLVAVARAAAEAPPSPENERDYRRAAGELRRQVWDPLASSVAGARTVFLVPDGALQLVSFAALPVPKGRYLVETGPELVTLSTERDLLAAPEAAEPGRGLLVVGGVDFDRSSPLGFDDGGGPSAIAAAEGRPLYRGAHSACPDFSSLRLAALPATEREAGAVAALWRTRRAWETARDTSVQALLGPRASEDRFKRFAPTCRVLHVATHGFFVRPECGPGTGFADRPERYVVEHENALLRSGLALAGFNAREHAEADSEDGVLTAEEVAALDLSGVRCVVLSACESGVGDVVFGEGVFGLRRAFMLAGAPTVVITLSRVRDVPARAWTQAFYDAFARGVPASRAAASASRALLARNRAMHAGTHPSEWGAFIAIGGWR